MWTEFGAGAELGFQPIDSAAVWTRSNSQGDPFCGFDVFGQRRFSLTEVQNIRTADAFGHSLAFGRIFGHPVEGAGHFGGGSGRLVGLCFLPVEFGDLGVEFGSAAMSAAAELVAFVFGDCGGGGRGLGGLDRGPPVGLEGAVPGEFLGGAVQFGQFLFEAGDGRSAPGGGFFCQPGGVLRCGGLFGDDGVEPLTGVGEFAGEGFVGEVPVFAFRPGRDLGFCGGPRQRGSGDPGR